jgi:hypothetical protein
MMSFMVVSGGFLALAGSSAQDGSPPTPTPSSPPSKSASVPKQADKSARDVRLLSPLHRQIDLSARQGADWLFRSNQPDGRFRNGYVPALRTQLEGDHYLHQVGAAFALARAARYTGNERYLARARQAVLTLLLDTAPDSQDPRLRHTTVPSVFVNRLGAAGWLVMAINELAEPATDLLEQSEQLCAFIQRQQQADGSLNYADCSEDGKPLQEDPDGINQYPGPALYGLMRSQLHRPATWKTELVRKAAVYYASAWRKQPHIDRVPWHTAAFAEAYRLTKDQAFADAIFEMNDWIAGFQYTQLDPRHPLWLGGFMGFAEGKPSQTAPQVQSAFYGEGLAEAARVARQLGDVNRHHRYQAALKGCLQFLTTLQYNDANTTHFADWYKKDLLLGGFHASHQDGNLRLDYTQHAICAMIQYLTDTAD